MLHALSNFWSIVTAKMIKRKPSLDDLIALGTRDKNYGGGYKATAITVADFIASLPGGAVIADGVTIGGAGTSDSPLFAIGAPLTDKNIIFVSPNGDDLNPGTLEKPVKSLYVARDLSSYGDLVYVLPGRWRFDNTDANNNYYNGANYNLYLNLWKDGVNYYFSPGTTVMLLNQTQTANEISLFKPTGLNRSSCNVYGYLNFTCQSIGPDSYGGQVSLFSVDDSYAFDYSCSMEINSAVTASTSIINLVRNVGGNLAGSNFRLTANNINRNYSSGQSGNGAAIYCGDNTKTQVILKIETFLSSQVGLYVRNATDTTLDVDYMRTFGELVYARAYINSTLTANIKNGHYTTTYNAGCIFSTNSSANNRIKITGNFYEYGAASANLFGMTNGSGNTLIVEGNIFINTLSGNGRSIMVDYASNKTFINANIEYRGLDNVSVPFYTVSTGLIVFSGYMQGNFIGSVAYPPAIGGKIIIKNSRLDFSTKVGSQLLIDTAPALGVIVIENSTVLINSVVNSAGQAQWFILNSAIKNVNPLPAKMFSNTTTLGSLQVINSSLINRGAPAIDYTGTASVTLAGAMSNSTVSAVSLNGSITTITTLNIS